MFTLKPIGRRNRVTATTRAPIGRKPALLGQTVVVLGGSTRTGLEIARRARAEGADVILTGRDPERLERAAVNVGARSTGAFDADDKAALQRFFDGLAATVDHVVVTAEDGADDGPQREQPTDHDAVSERVVLAVAHHAVATLRPGGTLLFIDGTGGRQVGRDPGTPVARSTVSARFTEALAAALAPVRVRVARVAPGSVDAPLPAALARDELAMRRAAPTGGSSTAQDGVAALAVRAMANAPLTSASRDLDDDRRLLARAV